MGDMNMAAIWDALAAPLDASDIKVRDDKDRKIRYIDARTVFERLNLVVPGQWTFETELLHVPSGEKGDKWVFKGRLTICGVWQEDVGMNDNEQYFEPAKSAVSDALKRCAVHFGIGLELYPGHGDNAQSGYSKPAPKAAQKPLAPATAPEPPDDGYSHPATSRSATEGAQPVVRYDLPHYDKLMSTMDGKELNHIQTWAWMELGINAPNHFTNKWRKIYGVRDLKQIPGTFGEFMARMQLPTEEPQPEGVGK